MRTVVIGIPHLASVPDGESLLRQNLPHLTRLAEVSQAFGIAPSGVDESAWLGLPPKLVRMAPGPLAVAAFGADPPDRSVHFCLSLLGCNDLGQVLAPGPAPTELELGQLLAELERLNSKTLTVVRGVGMDHALVWEDGSLELGTVEPPAAIGEFLRDRWPEGDGERILRRYVDDSVNLLTPHEVNQRRLDEGLPAINLAWPWGQGFRVSVPNLALRRGSVARVWSRSVRLRGLTRLAGYRPADPTALGNGFRVDWKSVADAMATSDQSLVVFDAIERARQANRLEEGAWWLREWDDHFLSRLLEILEGQPWMLLILALGDSESPGFGIKMNSERRESSIVPFDERALDEPSLPRWNLWEIVDHAFNDSFAPSSA